MNSIEKRYYFDANALLKYYQDEDGSLKIRRLVSNSSTPILISPLSLLECLSVVMKFYRRGIFKRKTVNSIVYRLRRDREYGSDAKKRPFQVIPIPDDTFMFAENILFQHAFTFDIGSNDALHLAIVKKLQLHLSPILVTSDNSMQKVCERLSISFYDPEIDDTDTSG
jgi:predicted nucleic acid-binding protein